ncbi:phage tail assembly chaperone [Pseudomonas sp. 6D_7.1_Bac1]|uniref:phage tail assembly chaperone n=1 Tax=Pseudomonas sp. 6D_7.1_Bac1 TaxID=2971615 RepID=UPI0021CAD595|nr:phage tail assembly chaperone [Pseudomonas sp. 6D_7.1_Bac1]MCU1750433.1 phage tail assembly chaperone [Pseudomonas sp. 6D_7.1_Bac1]
MHYKLITSGVCRLADSVFIPEDPANRDWITYQEWLSHGGESLPMSSNPGQEGAERAWRDSELFLTDGVIARHRDELEAGIATTLSAAEYENLQTYRRNLRNWPAAEAFPELTARPVLLAPVSVMAAPVRKARVRKSVKPVEASITQ